MKCFEIKNRIDPVDAVIELTVNMKCFEIKNRIDPVDAVIELTVNMKCFEINFPYIFNYKTYSINRKHEMFWNIF